MIGCLRGNNFNDLTCLQLIIKAYKLSVNLRSLHFIAHLRMYRIGKVNDGSSCGQRYNISLGGKRKNILGSKVALYGTHDLLNIVCFLLSLNYLSYPCKTAFKLVLALYALFVFPMGSDTVLGSVVHIQRSYLNLKGNALSADNSGMKRLIHIRLGSSDVVLEAVGDRLIHIVNDTQSVIALVYRSHYDTNRINIIYLVKTLALYKSLSINAVNRFHSARHLRLGKTHFKETLCYLSLYRINKCLTLVAAYFKHLLNFLIGIGVKITEGKILYLVLYRSDTQTMSDRGIYIHGFQCRISLLVSRTELECTHIMKSVTELYYNNSDIL